MDAFNKVRRLLVPPSLETPVVRRTHEEFWTVFSTWHTSLESSRRGANPRPKASVKGSEAYPVEVLGVVQQEHPAVTEPVARHRTRCPKGARHINSVKLREKTATQNGAKTRGKKWSMQISQTQIWGFPWPLKMSWLWLESPFCYDFLDSSIASERVHGHQTQLNSLGNVSASLFRTDRSTLDTHRSVLTCTRPHKVWIPAQVTYTTKP
jgi:hypothetical protein